MSDEHGWAEFADGHDPDTPDDLPYEFPAGPGDDPVLSDDGDLGLPELDDDTGPDLDQPPAADDAAVPEPVWEQETPEAQPVHTSLLGPVGADPDAAAPGAEAVSVFPPLVDVGALPEPVDGFPWIDTGSLGVIDPMPPVAADPVTAQDLAAYAGQELPPAADPWAALAGAEDPATSALARWWTPEA